MIDITTIGIGVQTDGVVKGQKELDKFGQSANKASKEADKVTKSANESSKASTALAGSVKLLGAAYVALAGLRGLGATIDAYTKYTAQLKLATRSQEEYNSALQSVSRIATTAQADIGAIGTLYARLNNALRDLGATQQQVSDITENVGLALKVSGASASETASAMLQLSQAFASGVLRGEEFNAVNESAPALMRALAESMGVPIGKLRELASNGQITSDVLMKAFGDPKLLESFRNQAKEVQTLSGAIQLLKNEFTVFIGEVAKRTGVVDLFTLAINAGSGALKSFNDYLATGKLRLEAFLPAYDAYRKKMDEEAGKQANKVTTFTFAPKISDELNAGDFGVFNEEKVRQAKEINALYDSFTKNIKINSVVTAEQNKIQEDAKKLLDAEKITREDYNKIIAESNNLLANLNKGEDDRRKKSAKSLEDLAAKEEKTRKYLFNLQQELDDEVTKRYNQAEKIRATDDKAEYERKLKNINLLQAAQDRANDEQRRQQEELAREQKRLNEEFSRSLTDAIFRGFESGKSFIQNFKDTLINAFKTLILRPRIEAIISVSGIGAILGGGNANASGLVDGSLSGGGGILNNGISGAFNDVMNIFSKSNASIIGGIETLGGKIANGMGGIRDTIGGYLGANASFVSNAMSYGGAILQAAQGNWGGAIGTGIGTAVGGPVGGAIGSFLGGAVGGLFGKSKAKRPVYISSASSTYDAGKFNTSFGTLAGQPKQVKSLGADANLEQVNQAFSESLGALLGSFGQSQKISTSIRLWKRKAALGWFDANFGDGESISLYSDLGRGDTNAAFQTFFNRVLTEGIVSSIQKTKLPEGVKALFNGLADKTVINTLINDVIRLNSSATKLNQSFDITVDQVALMAKESDIAGENFTKLVNTLTEAANEALTVGQALTSVRTGIIDVLGAIPDSMKSYDEAIKAINTSTAEGRQEFLKYLDTRGTFKEYQAAIDGLKGGVKGALFGIVSDAEKQQIMNEDLAKLFADLNREVPASIEELIALGKSIDYTTEEGLNLAAVFPALVEAFNATKNSVDSLMNSLRDASKFASSFEYNRYLGVSSNYGASFANQYVDSMPSYAVGTDYVPSDGVAMLHQGEAVLTKSDNANLSTSMQTVAGEISSLRNEQASINSALQSIAISAMKSERSLDRLQKDGFIIRDVDANGDPQVIQVEMA